MTRLSVRSLGVEYGRGAGSARPFSDLSLEVDSGELVLLMGPSGCGKTTLVSCLAGVLTPARGTIRLGDVEVTALRGAALARYRRRTCGVVFQAFNLIQSLSALENVAVPLQNSGTPWSDARARAALLLSDVGLADQGSKLPGLLSGGQQQRVAIARALGGDPPLLLADEPTAHLDDEQALAVARILRELARPGRIVIVATHDDRLVSFADRTVRLGTAASSTGSGPSTTVPPPWALPTLLAPSPPAPAAAPPDPLPRPERRPMPPALELARPLPAAPPRPVLTAFAPPPPQPVRRTPAVPPPFVPAGVVVPGPAGRPAGSAAAVRPAPRRRRRAPLIGVAVGAAAALVAGLAALHSSGAPGGSPPPAVASDATPSSPSPTASAAPATAAGAAPPAPAAPPTARPRVPATRRPAPAPAQAVTKVASAAPVPASAVPAAPVAAAVEAPVTHTFSVLAYSGQGSVSWYDVGVRPMRITVTPDAWLCPFTGGRVTALDLYQGSSLIAHFTPAPGCGAQTTPLYTPSAAAPPTYSLVATTSMPGMTVALQVTEGS